MATFFEKIQTHPIKSKKQFLQVTKHGYLL